jgi:hypothetical protein
MPRSKTKATDGEEVGVTGTARARAKRPSASTGTPEAAADTPSKRLATPVKTVERRKKVAPKAKEPSARVYQPETGTAPTETDIAVRAYFIGEHRRYLGLAGDSEGDWLEAERQLRSEASGLSTSA